MVIPCRSTSFVARISHLMTTICPDRFLARRMRRIKDHVRRGEGVRNFETSPSGRREQARATPECGPRCAGFPHRPALSVPCGACPAAHAARSHFPDWAQAIEGKSDALADADSGGAYESESVGFQRVHVAELLLQALILLARKRSGQIVVMRWEILATNEVERQGMTMIG